MTVEQRVLRELYYLQLEEKREIERKYDTLRSIFEACESPIEQMFLLNIIKSFYGSCVPQYDFYDCPRIYCDGWNEDSFTVFDVLIYPQYIIPRNSSLLLGNDRQATTRHEFRADFLFEITRHFKFKDDRKRVADYYRKYGDFDETLERIMGRIVGRLVVEIDGHDFHERTKEQAKRDRSRDREMIRSGYTVFRFTGWEVHNEIERVIDEVQNFLESRVDAVRDKKIYLS